jgi:hypothetical protein
VFFGNATRGRPDPRDPKRRCPMTKVLFEISVSSDVGARRRVAGVAARRLG